MKDASAQLNKKDVAVLVGNGLSIAFNPELNLEAITKTVLDRIQAAEGDDVVTAMQAIAEHALPRGTTSDADFEVLVGAFGAESRSLGLLGDLAQLTEPKDKKLRKSIRMTAKFAEQVRDSGISHVLQVISERSHAYKNRAQHLKSLVTEITSSFDGNVVFGNLNYDTLLLAALVDLCQDELADLGHGARSVSIKVKNEEKINVPPLRRNAYEFPEDKRVRLLHLHGSLTYWATKDGKIHAKLSRDLLENHEQWEAIRQKTTDVRPMVVLANEHDKANHVSKFPFKLAYEMFTTALSNSDHWLIIGYSFRDDPVNSMLHKVFTNRSCKPKVHVVTLGDDPTRDDIEEALGWRSKDAPSDDWLIINRAGANGAEKTEKWQTFIDDPM